MSIMETERTNDFRQNRMNTFEGDEDDNNVYIYFDLRQNCIIIL